MGVPGSRRQSVVSCLHIKRAGETQSDIVPGQANCLRLNKFRTDEVYLAGTNDKRQSKFLSFVCFEKLASPASPLLGLKLAPRALAALMMPACLSLSASVFFFFSSSWHGK